MQHRTDILLYVHSNEVISGACTNKKCMLVSALKKCCKSAKKGMRILPSLEAGTVST